MRNEFGFSQRKVADFLKIAQNTLSQYETGDRNIPNDILVRLAVLYQTSVDYLLDLTDERTPHRRAEGKQWFDF